MSKITSGEVVISLDGEERTLRPTLNAATRINSQFGGFAGALGQIQALNLEAMTYIVRQGLGASDAEAKGLREQVYQAGVLEMVGPLSRYVMLLANGGKLSSDEGEGEGDGGK